MFENRTDAGRQLAEVLDDLDVEVDVVLAVPRGGLPVGRAVADRLGIPLDVVAAGKIGVPGDPELAVGAVASDGTVRLNESLVAELAIEDSYLEDRIEHERAAARERVRRYREGRPPLELRGKRVLVVDDGIATGASTRACMGQVRNAGAERVILAVPVASPETVERLRPEVDDVVCVETPPHFQAVGQFYDSFEQVTDEEAKAYPADDEP